MQLRVELKPSKYFAVVMVFIHITAIGILWVLPFSVWVKLILILAILIQLGWILHKKVFLRSPKSVVQLISTTGQDWLLGNKKGEFFEGVLKGPYLVTSGLVILNFKMRGFRRFSLVIFSDAAERGAFHLLRVKLLLRK